MRPMPATVCCTMVAPSVAVLLASCALSAARRQLSAILCDVVAIYSQAEAMVPDWIATLFEPFAICSAFSFCVWVLLLCCWVLVVCCVLSFCCFSLLWLLFFV